MNEAGRFTSSLRCGASGLGIVLTDRQIDAMYAYYRRVVETNRQLNLTRLTEAEPAAVRLFADSLAPVAWARGCDMPVRTVLDIGTGAGFPGVVIAIVEPRWTVTAIDATAKKINFVRSATREIGVPNLRVMHARAEHWDCRASFGLVTLKAIGSLARSVETAHRFVAPGGVVAVFKSASIATREIDAGQRTAQPLGLAMQPAWPYAIPLAGETIRSSLFVFRRAC